MRTYVLIFYLNRVNIIFILKCKTNCVSMAYTYSNFAVHLTRELHTTRPHRFSLVEMLVWSCLFMCYDQYPHLHRHTKMDIKFIMAWHVGRDQIKSCASKRQSSGNNGIKAKYELNINPSGKNKKMCTEIDIWELIMCGSDWKCY